MYIVVDERPLVANGYVASFGREGVASVGLYGQEFGEWLETAPRMDMEAVQGFLLGDSNMRPNLAGMIQKRSKAPIIALSDARCLDQTLDLFVAGVDDVVRKPVHVREIMARSEAIRRRTHREVAKDSVAADRTSRLKVFFDGRDAEIDGEKLALPRRERQILEFLIRNRGRRMNRTQVYNAIYGAFSTDVDESVVEGHVSKLRKKLRGALHFDPIEVKRYMGYAFVG